MERVLAGVSGHPARRDERPARARAAPSVERVLELQRTVGNRAVTRVLARMWRPQTGKGGGKGMANTNRTMEREITAVIDSMAHMRVGAGSMVVADPYRIDYQGASTAFPGFVNIQLQRGNLSYAGVLCPPALGMQTVIEGLKDSLESGRMMVWVPDPAAAEEPDEKPQPKKKPPPKGGGKGGKGGGKGGRYGAPVAVQ